MNLKEIGEFGFIKRFAHRFDELIQGDDKGIGDDCAMLSINETDYHLISTDLLIEDIHFLKDRISPQELGHKALAVNLSDIAAMGGKPLYSFLSIGIPKDTEVDYLDRFMEGYHQLSSKYKVALMGGDTTSSKDKLVINVAVVGQALKKETRLRSMAKRGDLICTTGTLGDSAAGLKALLDNTTLTDNISTLIKRHHTPQPRINEGQWLAKQSGVHAMMDISDGIASDLNHILTASSLSAEIILDDIPKSELLKRVAQDNGWDDDALATSGGEDYELLLSIQANKYEGISKAFYEEFKKPLYTFGLLGDGEEGIKWIREGKETPFNGSGFNHFSIKTPAR